MDKIAKLAERGKTMFGKGKHMEGIRDLKEYGFDLLTGEACGISMRLLIDVSPEAVKILEEFLSVQFTEENNSWNHGGQDGWKSIMLSRNMIDDLLVFVLCREFPYVIKVQHKEAAFTAFHVRGFPDKESFEEFKERANRLYTTQDEHGDTVYHYRVYYSTETYGTRNRHEFSGRVA